MCTALFCVENQRCNYYCVWRSRAAPTSLTYKEEGQGLKRFTGRRGLTDGEKLPGLGLGLGGEQGVRELLWECSLSLEGADLVYSLGQTGPGLRAHQAIRDESRVPGSCPRAHSREQARGCPGQYPLKDPDAPRWIRKPVLGLGLLSKEASFPFEKVANAIYTRVGQAGGWGRNLGQARWLERAYLLPATTAGRGGRGGAARTTCRRRGDRWTYTLRAGQGRREPGRRREREPKLGERSDLGAGGGAASGAAGASASGSALAQEAESAAHPTPGESAAGRGRLGWGLLALDPCRDPAANSPLPR